MRNSLNDRNYLCSELIRIEFADERGKLQNLDGNLESISRSKLSILLDSKVAYGTSLVVIIQGHRLHGRAESAQRDEVLGWFVDVDLQPQSNWSEQWFAPKHLFALSSALREATTAA